MRGAAAVLICLFFLALAAPSAHAHANYYQSEPARGARLTEPPSTVTVTLSEPIDPAGSSLEVRDQDRQRVDEGPVRFEGGNTPTLSVDLRAALGPGAYQATWKALSTVDGHVTDGTFGFAVGGFEPPADAPEATDYDPLSAAVRTLAYAGFAVGFGAVAFTAYIEPRPIQPGRARLFARLFAASGVLIFLGVAALLLHTSNEAGRGIDGFLQTTVGREFALRLAAATATLALGLSCLRSGPMWKPMAALLLLDAAGNSMFAHSAQKGWWASAIDAAHLVSIATWLGGLVLFLQFIVLMSRTGTYVEVVTVGRRFSRVALTSVIVLGATGLLSTLLILGTHVFRNPFAIWTHPYGVVLAGKITLFGVMVALAGVNRFVFLGERPGPDSAPPFPQRIFDALFPTLRNRGTAFARAVASEATLGVAVLILAGFLTAISPPAGAPADATEGVQAVGFGTDHNVTLRLRPAPQVGRDANVSLLVEETASGRPLEKAVRVRVTIAAAGENETGGETYLARHEAGGVWAVGDVLFSKGGAHEARIEIQTEDVYSDVVVIAFHVLEAAAPS